jgi:hypothetical protein
MQVRATLPDHIVRQRSMSRTKKPVGWDERQRNPSPCSECRSKTMGFTEPVIGPATSGRTRWFNPSYGLEI